MRTDVNSQQPTLSTHKLQTLHYVSIGSRWQISLPGIGDARPCSKKLFPIQQTSSDIDHLIPPHPPRRKANAFTWGASGKAYLRWVAVYDILSGRWMVYGTNCLSEDAIDSGQYKHAVQTCTKILKKQPKLDLVKASLYRVLNKEHGLTCGYFVLFYSSSWRIGAQSFSTRATTQSGRGISPLRRNSSYETDGRACYWGIVTCIETA